MFLQDDLEIDHITIQPGHYIYGQLLQNDFTLNSNRLLDYLPFAIDDIATG